MSQFAHNLRFLRKMGQHNQVDISQLFNKKANTVGNWENSKSEPSLAELVTLAGFFGVAAHDLLSKNLESEGVAQSLNPPLVQLKKEDKLPFEQVSRTNEAGGEQFGIIIKELRRLQEKVDLLASGLESMSIKHNSDKSSY